MRPAYALLLGEYMTLPAVFAPQPRDQEMQWLRHGSPFSSQEPLLSSQS